MDNRNPPSIDTMLDEVVAGINVLCLRVVFRVLGEGLRSFIVDMER